MSEAQQKIDKKTNEPDDLAENLAAETGSGSDDQAYQTTDDSDSKNNKGKGLTGFIAFIALIIAVAAFVAGYKALQEIGTEQTAFDNRLNTTEKSVSKIKAGAESSRTIAESVRASNQQMQGRLESAEGKVNAISGQVESSVGKLNSNLAKFESSIAALQQNDAALKESISQLGISEPTTPSYDEDKMLVAEARQLITIANHQAQLNHNPAAAAAALEAADKRLSDTSDPSLLKARQIITDDIIALRNVATHDISGIALTLSQLEKSVTGLPLKDEDPATSAEAEGGTEQEQEESSSIFSKIESDIKSLVTVRRTSEEANAALLPPGQRFFLQQNLRLKLQTARLALLQRDTQTFHDSLATATQWIETYFDGSAASTANLLSTIASYQELELMPNLPDISNSLKALEEWSSSQQNAAITTSVEVAES